MSAFHFSQLGKFSLITYVANILVALTKEISRSIKTQNINTQLKMHKYKYTNTETQTHKYPGNPKQRNVQVYQVTKHSMFPFY